MNSCQFFHFKTPVFINACVTSCISGELDFVLKLLHLRLSLIAFWKTCKYKSVTTFNVDGLHLSNPFAFNICATETLSRAK